jgi:hypothetical protein
MSGLRPRDSCREAFKDWGILPLQSQYIFSLLIFVVNNMVFYHSTSQIHGFTTIRNFDLYRLQTNLSICQRRPYYFGIKLFNHLPLNIKELSCNAKQFRTALRVGSPFRLVFPGTVLFLYKCPELISKVPIFLSILLCSHQ